MKIKIICTHCGHKYKDKIWYGSVCPDCGYIQKNSLEPDKWYCDHCGHKCSISNAVCPVCGHTKK